MTVDYQDLVLKELNYHSYLKIGELLNLQELRSKPAHHDEMFFIIIHQTAELWFKEMLHETSILVAAFHEGEVSKALKVLKRIHAIMDFQVTQIRLLATLTPIEFAGFRDILRPASGFQSAQFREIEFAYGLRNPFFKKFFENIPEVAARLDAVQKSPSVYDSLMKCLQIQGFEVPTSVLNRDIEKPWELNQELLVLIKEIYQNPSNHYHLVLLFESMVDFDEALMLWRKTHAVMVARTIGHKQGTGGSKGYDFLRSREDLSCFPELWEVRNEIGGAY